MLRSTAVAAFCFASALSRASFSSWKVASASKAEYKTNAFPHVHDGWDRLGMVHEARGENKQAADCYRKAIEIIRAEPEMYHPQFADVFVKLVDKLDPPGAAQTTE